MKILPIPVVKIEQKSIQISKVAILKAAAIFLISIAIVILLFSQFYISSICLGLVALLGMRIYQFVNEVNSIDWKSVEYQLSLESIIADLEGH
jgi:hypothetical protein